MFYDNFLRLCNSVNKTPSAVALEIGIEKSTVSRWKKGGYPTDATLQKVADYFGVPVRSLAKNKLPLQTLAEEAGFRVGAELLQQIRFTGTEGDQIIGLDDFTYAMHEESANLTEGDKALLLAMAQKLNAKNKNGKTD